jgi:hypothetical protein
VTTMEVRLFNGREYTGYVFVRPSSVVRAVTVKEDNIDVSDCVVCRGGPPKNDYHHHHRRHDAR